MGNQEDATVVFLESALEFFFGGGVKVVGGLVKDQDVGGLVHDFAEADLGFFAAGEDLDLELVLFGGEAALREHGPNFVLHEGGEFFPDEVDGGFFVVVFLLAEVADVEVLTEGDVAGDGWLVAEDGVDEGGFA